MSKMNNSDADLLDCFTHLPYSSGRQLDQDLIEAALCDSACSSVGTVLVLYTGGTIGMRSHGGIYEPEANFLVKALLKMSLFQDITFKDRNKIHLNYYTSNSKHKQMRSSNVIPALATSGKSIGWPTFCVQPTNDGRRIFYTIAEYSNLLDSSNCTTENWIQVAKHIELFYDEFDGFIVLHGTDTLAYASSFLSFILQNLRKPVVVTGSQIPIGELRSDGRENFLGSLLIAGGHYQLPEVCVYFNNKLFRGNRVSKCATGDLEAFTSLNYPLLADIGTDIVMKSDYIRQPVSDGTGLQICDSLCKNVVLLRIFPSITSETIKAFFRPQVEGVILQTYGTDNLPNLRQDLLYFFKEATEKRGVIVLNITQCWKGSVETSYSMETSLKQYGIISGHDMTPEAALAKVAYVLGRWSDNEMRRIMLSKDLQGEMTIPTPKKMNTCKKFSLCDVTTGQTGLYELVGKLGHFLSSADAVSSATAWANRLLPLLFCSAAESNDVEELDQLFQITGSFEYYDGEHRGPMHIAAARANLEACEFMLQNKINPNETDRYGCTPLTYAVMSKQTTKEFVRTLLKYGATLSPDEKIRAREANLAAMRGKIGQLRLYRMAGMSLEELDAEGRAPLHVAVAYRQIDTVCYLVSPIQKTDSDTDCLELSVDGAGTNPNILTSYHATALQEAEIRHLHEIVNILKPLTLPTAEPNE